MASSVDVHASWVDKEASAKGGTHPDIKLLVDHYRKISFLHSIAIEALRIVQDLVLWKNKLFSVLSMLLVCLVCLLPELFLMVCLQACVVVMLLGRWYSRIAPKREDRGGGSRDDDIPDVEADMAEFVRIVHQVQALVVKGSQVLDELTSIASWTRPALSLCVTLYLCLQAGILVFLGARWFLAFLPLAIYCFNSGFRQAFQSNMKSPWAIVEERESPPNEPSTTQGAQDTTNSSTNPSSNHDTEVHQNRSGNFGFLQAQQRSRARGRGRLQPGNCTDCKASFAKLLKRKHRCNSCGLDFCGNCTVKVKKFLLGATSPAAYEDSVRVCMACSDQLKAMDSELSSFASQRTTSAVGPTSKPTQQQTRADAARSSPRAEQPSTDTAMCPSCSHNPAQQSCNSCGLDFCGNCTVEVKKFLLGATSPAAYEDSVRVCMACSDQLKAMDSELSSFASQRTVVGPTSHPTLLHARTDAHRRSPRAEQASSDTACSEQQ